MKPSYITSRFSRCRINFFRCHAMKTAVAALLLSTLALSGCVGVITIHNPTTHYDAASIKLGGKGYCCSGVNDPVSTKAEIIQSWGQPDKQWTKGNSEMWQYFRDGLSWAGIMPVLVIPVPLLVPTGRHSTTFIFTDDKLTSVEVVDGKMFMALCGLFLMDHGPNYFGCHAG